VAEDTNPTPPQESLPADLPAPIDYSTLSLEQLSGIHADLASEHATLIATPLSERTVAQNRRIVELQRDASTIEGLVAEFASASTIEALAPIEVPAAATTLDVEVETPIAELNAPEGVSVAELALQADRAMRTNARTAPEAPSVPARAAKYIAAGAGQQVSPVGARLSLAEAGAILTDAQRSGAKGMQKVLRYASDSEPVLIPGDAVGNTRRIMEAYESVETRTAAATCGPPEPLRDVQSSATRGTPVFDAFGAPLRAARGSFSFLASPGLGTAAVASSTQVWTDTNQNAIVDGTVGTWKPLPYDASCGTVPCAAEAVPAGLAVKKIDDLTSPEYVGALLDAVGAAQDRAVESYILARIDANSYNYNANTTAYGTMLAGLGSRVNATDIIGRILGGFAAINRNLPEVNGNYHAFVEAGFISHIYLDEVARLDESQEAEIATKMFADLGVSGVTITPDWSTADSGGPWAGFLSALPSAVGNSPVAVPARPSAWTVRLVDLSAFFPFEVDEESISMVPDLSDRRKNRVSYFGERWPGLCKRLTGVPTARINFSSLYSSGNRAAGVAVTEG
jgi:hypothetical protein